MRFARLALVAGLIGLADLALLWRFSVMGVTPDPLFVLVVFACVTLRAGSAVPVACGVGLLADFLLGGRLGVMAIGYALGARLVEGLRPHCLPLLRGRTLSAAMSSAETGDGGSPTRSWRSSGRGIGAVRSSTVVLLRRVAWVVVITRGGALAAHVAVARLGAVLPGAGGAGPVGARIVKAAEIAFLTAAAAPLVWPVLAVALGGLAGPLRAPRGPGAG